MTAMIDPIAEPTTDEPVPDKAPLVAAAAIAGSLAAVGLANVVGAYALLVDPWFVWGFPLSSVALVIGLIVGGHMSDRLGPRRVFGSSLIVALVTVLVATTGPSGGLAVIAALIAVAATAFATSSAVVAIGASSTRAATGIAIVLGAETALLFVYPTAFSAVTTAQRPVAMVAGLVLLSATAAWLGMRSLPSDRPRTNLQPSALYDGQDLRALASARLLGASGVALGVLAGIERLNGIPERGPLVAIAIGAAILLGGAVLALRTRLLGAVDLRRSHQPATLAVVAASIALSFGVGVDRFTASDGARGLDIDVRVGLALSLAGLAVAAAAADRSRGRTVLVGLTAVIAIAGLQIVLVGLDVIDPVLGGLINVTAGAAGGALAVIAVHQVTRSEHRAIAGVTTGFALAALQLSTWLGAAFAPSPTFLDLTDSANGSEGLLERSSAGTGAVVLVLALVAAALIRERRT